MNSRKPNTKLYTRSMAEADAALNSVSNPSNSQENNTMINNNNTTSLENELGSTPVANVEFIHAKTVVHAVPDVTESIPVVVNGKTVVFMAGNGKFFEAHIYASETNPDKKLMSVEGLLKSKELMNAFSYLNFDKTHYAEVNAGRFMHYYTTTLENAYVSESNAGNMVRKGNTEGWPTFAHIVVDGEKKTVPCDMKANDVARIGYSVKNGFYGIVLQEPEVVTNPDGSKVAWTDDQWHDFKAIWLTRYLTGLQNGVGYKAHPIIKNNVDELNNVTKRGGESASQLLNKYLTSFQLAEKATSPEELSAAVGEVREYVHGKVVGHAVRKAVAVNSQKYNEAISTGEKISLPADGKDEDKNSIDLTTLFGQIVDFWSGNTIAYKGIKFGPQHLTTVASCRLTVKVQK
jgi:hypothetical protein